MDFHFFETACEQGKRACALRAQISTTVDHLPTIGWYQFTYPRPEETPPTLGRGATRNYPHIPSTPHHRKVHRELGPTDRLHGGIQINQPSGCYTVHIWLYVFCVTPRSFLPTRVTYTNTARVARLQAWKSRWWASLRMSLWLSRVARVLCVRRVRVRGRGGLAGERSGGSNSHQSFSFVDAWRAIADRCM